MRSVSCIRRTARGRGPPDETGFSSKVFGAVTTLSVARDRRFRGHGVGAKAVTRSIRTGSLKISWAGRACGESFSTTTIWASSKPEPATQVTALRGEGPTRAASRRWPSLRLHVRMVVERLPPPFVATSASDGSFVKHAAGTVGGKGSISRRAHRHPPRWRFPLRFLVAESTRLRNTGKARRIPPGICATAGRQSPDEYVSSRSPR
jgi:hypothetical protein